MSSASGVPRVEQFVEHPRVLLDGRGHLGGCLPPVTVVFVDQEVPELVVDVVSRLNRLVGQRGCTAGTVVRVGPKPGVTPRAVIQIWPRGWFSRRRHVVVFEDLLVEFLVTDARVDLEHVAVGVPTRPVSDRLLGHAFPDPPADCCLPEVMRGHTVTFDASIFGDRLDTPCQVLVAHRTVVVGISSPATSLVDYGDIRFTPTGVHVQPRREVALAPGERHPTGRILDVGLFVDRNKGRLALEVDIADPKARDRGDSESGVGHECDECLVPRSVRGVQKLVNLFVGQQLVGIDGSVLWGADSDVVAPVTATVVEELPQCLAVVPQRTVTQVVVVSQAKEQFVNVLVAHVDQRRCSALCRESQSVEHGDHRSFVDAPFGILTPDECANSVTITIVDVRSRQLLELVLELPGVVLRVVDRGHTSDITGEDYEDSSGSPVGTTLTFDIILLGEPLRSRGSVRTPDPGSGSSVGVMSA